MWSGGARVFHSDGKPVVPGLISELAGGELEIFFYAGPGVVCL